MKKPFRSTDRSKVRRALCACFIPLACIAGGCGMLTSIKRDPLAVLGGNDNAPLPVVVQRADAASVTASEVDRLLTATPVAYDSAWPKQTQFSAEAISTFERSLADHPYYDATAFKICPAIIWADGLAAIGRDGASSAASEPSATPDASSDASASAPATTEVATSATGVAVIQVATTAPSPAATVVATTAPISAATIVTTAAPSTPVTRVAATAPSAAATTVATADASLATTPVATAAPNPTMPAGASADASGAAGVELRPSLLAAISSELGNGYAALQAKVQHVAALKAQLKAKELAQDRKSLSDVEKKKHEAAAKSLSAQVDKAKDEVERATDAYVASCRAAAAKVPAGVRDHFVVALMNLRQAVRDANAANAIAAIRYAELVPEIVSQPLRLKDVLVQVAKASVSDYIFERTGSRVKLSSLQPAVTFENGKVALVLNGISSSDLGNLKLDELLIETIARTERFAGKAATLYVTTSEAGEKLDFEGDVLDGILDGFRSAGCKTSDPTKIPDQTAKEIQASSSGALAKRPGLSFNPF